MQQFLRLLVEKCTRDEFLAPSPKTPKQDPQTTHPYQIQKPLLALQLRHFFDHSNIFIARYFPLLFLMKARVDFLIFGEK